jgi:hypothetical protein
VLAVLFGPGFSLIYAFRDQLHINKKHIVDLQSAFLDASAQFTIPVAIAAVVRLKQSAPLYEITFLESLTSMQFLALLSTSVATGIGPNYQSPKRIIVIVLYSIIDFSLYISIVAYLRTSKGRWESLKELSQACSIYGSNLLPGFVYYQNTIPAPHPTSPPPKFIDFKNKKGWRNWGIIMALVIATVAGILVLYLSFLWLRKAIRERSTGSLGILSLGLSTGMVYFAIQMESERNHMRSILGRDFEDDQWGFGQVVALCLWVPLGLQSIYVILGKYFTSGFQATIENIMTDMTLESLGHNDQGPVPDLESEQKKQKIPKKSVHIEDAGGDSQSAAASVPLPTEARSSIHQDMIETHSSVPSEVLDSANSDEIAICTSQPSTVGSLTFPPEVHLSTEEVQPSSSQPTTAAADLTTPKEPTV